MNKIKELRESKKIKQADLAHEVKVSQAALSGYETGKFQADIETYIRIADYFGVSLDYLIGEKTATKEDAVRIPVLGTVPAGIPMEAIEDIIDWEELPREMVSGGREYFALQVKGNSMWPDYLPGDVVIVRKQATCQNGDDCVVFVDSDDATLKTVRLDEADHSLTIIPKNQSYPPRTFSEAEIRDLPVTIAGVVVELRRKVGRK